MRRHATALVVTALLSAVVAFPLGAIASHQFTDVPTSNTFHDDIDAIRDAGVTTGCAAHLFCPKDFVTREQMAAFLNRLGALGPGKTPVVNADKVDGHDEVLDAGNIVMGASADWHPVSNAPVIITYAVDATQVVSASGERAVQIGLPAPVAIGDTTYGLQSVEVCHGASTGGPAIVQTLVVYMDRTATSFAITDTTERSLANLNCYLVTDPTPTFAIGEASVVLVIEYGAQATVYLRPVTVTWTPVSL